MRTDLSWLTARPIAHRGYHDLNVDRWENTLPAFEAAIAHDFAIECDVQLAADGVPVVLHDAELDRLAGRPGKLHDLASNELRALRVGTTQDHPPTLTEMLDLVAGRVPLIIELKGSVGHDAGLVAAVGRQLQRYRGPAAIMSFDHRLIREFAADAPGIPGGLTATGRGARDLEAHFSMLAHDICFASFNVSDLPNAFVTALRERFDLPVITWTVRDETGRMATREHADQMTFEGFDPDHV